MIDTKNIDNIVKEYIQNIQIKINNLRTEVREKYISLIHTIPSFKCYSNLNLCEMSSLSKRQNKSYTSFYIEIPPNLFDISHIKVNDHYWAIYDYQEKRFVWDEKYNVSMNTVMKLKKLSIFCTDRYFPQAKMQIPISNTDVVPSFFINIDNKTYKSVKRKLFEGDLNIISEISNLLKEIYKLYFLRDVYEVELRSDLQTLEESELLERYPGLNLKIDTQKNNGSKLISKEKFIEMIENFKKEIKFI